MKILVTGKLGQVAASLVERATYRRDVEVVAVGRPQMDLLDRSSVISRIVEERPDIVVSAAAYTAVDRAEDEPDLAYAVNVSGAAHVAEAAARIGAPIIHLSTDYVFSGDERLPYTEDCKTGPATIYGLTKLEGERAVARINPHHLILRTSWVHSPFGTNFVKTMLRLAGDRSSISVVSDQWGTPTSALDLADGLLRLAAGLTESRFGIYHLAGAGDTNWSDFARHIFRVSHAHGGPFADVVDISSDDYPAKARRPLNSRLSSAKVEQVFGWRPTDWRSGAETVVRRLVLASDAGQIPAHRITG